MQVSLVLRRPPSGKRIPRSSERGQNAPKRSLRPTGEERDGADDFDLDVGQLRGKPMLELLLVVLGVRKDALPVVESHETASEQVVRHAASENRAPEEDTARREVGTEVRSDRRGLPLQSAG